MTVEPKSGFDTTNKPETASPRFRHPCHRVVTPNGACECACDKDVFGSTAKTAAARSSRLQQR